jgi:hypothetical protein
MGEEKAMNFLPVEISLHLISHPVQPVDFQVKKGEFKNAQINQFTSGNIWFGIKKCIYY